MKNKFFLLAMSIVIIHLFSGGIGNLFAQTIEPSNIQAMAIYKISSEANEVLSPNQINFNIISSLVIESLISSIDFSTPRDGSDLLSLPNAFVYIRFKDNSISVFELFDVWEHCCKHGHPGRCYRVSQDGSKLFEAYAQ